VSDLVEVLRELQYGNIPQLLRDAGIRGEVGDCLSCPIALYLIERTGCVRADVGSDVTTLMYEDGTYESASNPTNVEAFVDRFDGLGYPDLIRSE